jgi:hypothetical protein
VSERYIEDPPGTLRPLELFEWARMLEDIDRRRVALYEGSHSGHEVRVYTTWIGLDHRRGDGPPLIYETMIKVDGAWTHYQERYTYRSEAVEGHERAVVWARAMFPIKGGAGAA